MSTKFYTSSTNPYVKYDRHIGMGDRQETLSDYVRRILHETGWSYRVIRDRAKRKGFDISHSIVGEIINNPEKTYQIDTLKALAAGLDVDYEFLSNLAMGMEVHPDLLKRVERDMKEIGRLLNEASDDGREYGLKLIETVKYDLRRRNQEASRKRDKAILQHPKEKASYRIPIRRKDLIRIPMIGPANANETPNDEKKKAKK